MVKTIWDGNGWKWLDLEAPTDHELLTVSVDFNIPISYINTCLEPDNLPNVIKDPNITYYSLRSLEDNHGIEADTIQELTQKLIIFKGEGYLITIHRRFQQDFENFCVLIADQLHDMQPANIIEKLIRSVLRTYEKPIAYYTQILDKYEERIFLHRAGRTVIKDLFHIKRKIAVFKRLLTLMEEVAATLANEAHSSEEHSKTILLSKRLRYNNEELYESVNALTNIFLSISAYRTNEVMRTLTIVSAIFMPLTFIVGIYGMNFNYMPELGWQYGYPSVMLLMLSMTLGLVWYFRYKGYTK